MDSSDAVGLVAAAIAATLSLACAFVLFWRLHGIADAWKGTAVVAGLLGGTIALALGSVRLASLIVTGA